MKKLTKQFISIITFVAAFSILSFGNIVNAQDDGKLYVSPSVKVVTFSSNSPISEEVIIKNTTNLAKKISLKPAIVQIQESSTLVENDSLSSLILIEDGSEFEIQANETITKKITINSPEQFSNSFYPAIIVDSFEKDDTAQIGVTSTIVSTFIIEDLNSTVGQEISVKISSSYLVGNEFVIKGEIKNTGERIFSPSGSIRISKANKKVEEVSITSEINKFLLPNQIVAFEKRIRIEEEKPFNMFGKYNIETIVTPSPYESFTTENSQIWVIPPVILIIAVILIAVIIMILGYTLFLLKRSKSHSRKKK